jgi:hypothetical protein
VRIHVLKKSENGNEIMINKYQKKDMKESEQSGQKHYTHLLIND